MVAPAPAHPFVEDDFAAGLVDELGDRGVALLREVGLTRMRSPQQARVRARRGTRPRRTVADCGARTVEQLVAVALPIGEVHTLARGDGERAWRSRRKYSAPSTRGVTSLPSVHTFPSARRRSMAVAGLPRSAGVKNQSSSRNARIPLARIPITAVWHRGSAYRSFIDAVPTWPGDAHRRARRSTWPGYLSGAGSHGRRHRLDDRHAGGRGAAPARGVPEWRTGSARRCARSLLRVATRWTLVPLPRPRRRVSGGHRVPGVHARIRDRHRNAVLRRERGDRRRPRRRDDVPAPRPRRWAHLALDRGAALGALRVPQLGPPCTRTGRRGLVHVHGARRPRRGRRTRIRQRRRSCSRVCSSCRSRSCAGAPAIIGVPDGWRPGPRSCSSCSTARSCCSAGRDGGTRLRSRAGAARRGERSGSGCSGSRARLPSPITRPRNSRTWSPRSRSSPRSRRSRCSECDGTSTR